MKRLDHVRFARIAALFFLMLLYTGSYVSFQPPAQAQSAKPDNQYGVNVFLHKEVETVKIERTLQMIQQANIKWIKQEFPWQEIEFKKGYFYDDKWQKSSWEKFDQIVDLAGKYGLSILARIDHAPAWAKADPSTDMPLKSNGDLADFTNALLDHYKGRINYVQLWNEPNLTGEWVPGKAVDPAAYAGMLKAVYPVVKASHPDVALLSAPMAMTLERVGLAGNMNEIDYWKGLYAAGVKGNFDIASANAYGLDQPPDAAPGPNVLNFRRVELLHDVMVQNSDASRPIWIDEYGWNASPESLPEAEKNYWRHVTPEQQAQWTVQGVDYARKHWTWAGTIFIWYFRQVGDIPPEKAEYYFAMVNPDFSPQPVYDAVKQDATGYSGNSPRPTSTTAPLHTRTPVPTLLPARPTHLPQVPPRTVTNTPLSIDSPTPTMPPAQAASTSTALSTPAQPVRPSSTIVATATATDVATATATAGQPSRTIVTTATVTKAVVEGGTVEQGGRNSGLYLVGGMLVVAGLGALGYYFMRRGNPIS
ncbi:MAG: cellulase family glycosylhydrolase [Chloroflexota bacterium]|nr:cellulase family glycosylhydrolase [Chloroflexota bacterium]